MFKKKYVYKPTLLSKSDLRSKKIETTEPQPSTTVVLLSVVLFIAVLGGGGGYLIKWFFDSIEVGYAEPSTSDSQDITIFGPEGELCKSAEMTKSEILRSVQEKVLNCE